MIHDDDNKNSHNNSSIVIVTGPMFSQKSSTLIREYHKKKKVGRKVLTTTWLNDSRSGKFIKSHDGEYIPAVVVRYLKELLPMDDYLNADDVIVDEGQFFEDLCDTVITMVRKDNKNVLVGGLFADYCAMPFYEMSKLMAHANFVIFLKSICQKCSDLGHLNVPATYTMKKINSAAEPCDNRIDVGGSDKYMPVCSNHFEILSSRTTNILTVSSVPDVSTGLDKHP